MEQATPILESFTESVGDGPSQPLLRKLMSLMFQPDAPGGDISGFFPAGTSGQRRRVADAVEDISLPLEHPLGEVESVERSGFRFPSSCDSPRPENYFADSEVPADLVDKVPLELLHAMNDALTSTSRSRDETPEPSARHDDGREGIFCLPRLAAARIPAAAESSRQEQDAISTRLARLESICLRTESYVRMAFGSLDRRLRLLETQSQVAAAGLETEDPRQRMAAEVLARERSSCPMSLLVHPAACNVSTFVTPDMLKQLPGVLVINDPAASTTDACLSPIEIIPSPSLIMSTPCGEQQRECLFDAPQTPDQRDAGRPQSSPTEDVGKPEIAGVAVFSLAGDHARGDHESTAEALSREPVVAWDNEGFPYLRPTQQVAMAPPLRDTIVMTWDGVGYLSRDTSDEDVATCLSSDDDAFSYNFNSFDQPRHSSEPATNDAAATSTKSEEVSASNQPEVLSVVERLFSSLISIPTVEHPEESTSERVEDEAPETPTMDEYTELPQHEDSLQHNEAEQSGKGFELITLDTREAGIVPRVRLAFKQQHEYPTNEHLVQHQRVFSSDMRLKVDFPRLQDAVTSDGQSPPVTVHLAVAPKEISQQDPGEAASREGSSIVQDVSLWVEGPYQGRATYDVVTDMPLDSPEAVIVSKDKLQLTEDLVADYTVKVVSGGSTDTETSSSEKPSAKADKVSSTIHQLCFSVDVPVSNSEQRVASQPDLPLEIAIGLSENPFDGEAVAKDVLRKGSASVVLNLEALQRSATPSSVASTSSKAASSRRLSRSESQGSLSSVESRNLADNEDSSCLLKVEDRSLVAEEEVPAIKEEICISVAVFRPPAESSETETAAGKSPHVDTDSAPDVQIGIAVKTVPSTAQLGALPAKVGALPIAQVEIPPEVDFQRVSFEDIAPLALRDVIPAKEELIPLAAAENMFQEACCAIDNHRIEPLAAPPPSPVDLSPSASLAQNSFKELTQLNKCREYQETDWHSESIFMVKDNVGPVLAMVPKAVLAGMAPTDLIRGSLHYDGKACLLSVCMDDIWTPEDMCQAPVSAAASFPQPNSNFEPFCVRGCIRELKAELDWIADKSKVRAFGFLKEQPESKEDKTNSKSLGFLPSQELPGVAAGSPGLSDVAFGFQKTVPQGSEVLPTGAAATESVPAAAAVAPADDAFADWDSSLSLVSRDPAKKKPPVPPALNVEPEQQQQEQLEKPRVPDSPGARSCIIDGEAATTEEPKTKVPDSPGATSCMLQGESPRVKPALKAELEQEKEERQQQVPKLAVPGRPPRYPATTTTTSRALDLLDAGGSCSDEESNRTSSGDLHLLPLERADAFQQEEEEEAEQQQQQEMFYDALQCSGSDSSQLGHSCPSCGPKPALFLLP